MFEKNTRRLFIRKNLRKLAHNPREYGEVSIDFTLQFGSSILTE